MKKPDKNLRGRVNIDDNAIVQELARISQQKQQPFKVVVREACVRYIEWQKKTDARKVALEERRQQRLQNLQEQL